MQRLACVLLLLFADATAAQSIALISDLNGRYGSDYYHDRVDQAVGAVVRLQPDLVISTGDMIAGQKQPLLDRAQLDRMWAAFNASVADPLARAGVPLAVTPGNHDGSAYPGFALERERFEAQWLPRQPPLQMLSGSEWPRRYAARLGGVLLIGFDGTRPGRLPDPEREFVTAMLREHGKGASATIVFSHLPMWPFATGREQEILDDPGLLALLHDHGVDVYASGHHHVFYAGVDAAGMAHVSVAALGGNARAFAGEQQRQPHGIALLEIAGRTINLRSLVAPVFQDPLPVGALPAAVRGPLGILRRLDGPVLLRP